MIYSTRGRQPKVYRLPPSCIALNGILLLSLCGGTLCSQFRHIILKIKQIHVSNLIVQPPFARNQPECLRHGEGQHISYQQRHKTIPLSSSSLVIV